MTNDLNNKLGALFIVTLVLFAMFGVYLWKHELLINDMLHSQAEPVYLGRNETIAISLSYKYNVLTIRLDNLTESAIYLLEVYYVSRTDNFTHGNTIYSKTVYYNYWKGTIKVIDLWYCHIYLYLQCAQGYLFQSYAYGQFQE